jgi:hypothetical protein
MRGVVLSLSRLSPILLVSLLVLSPHVLWAQRTSTPEERAVQLPDAPSQVATVSEAQTHLHLTYKGLPLSFKQDQGQTESWMRFFPDHTGYYRPINTNAALSRTAALWSKEKYLIGTAPSKGWTFAPAYGKVPHETTWRVGNLEHYVHRLPWAGPIILRIGQQAKTHPHVTRVLRVLKPRL